jgi:hypothetical protein
LRISAKHQLTLGLRGRKMKQLLMAFALGMSTAALSAAPDLI